MEQELEIEYKNELTEEEYQNILKTEFSNLAPHKITQWNHYFDTEENELKKQQSALRIRVADTYSEATFKVPAEGFLMETNIPLDERQTAHILDIGYFTLNDITNKKIDLRLNQITNETLFTHFNSFKTVRFEKKEGHNLMVLDQTTFQNGQVDYELEVESTDAILGQKYINSLLNKYLIPKRPTLPKIARAEKNR